MLQTAITKELPNGRTIEFVSMHETSITCTQIEIRGGLVYMRAKRRTYVFT